MAGKTRWYIYTFGDGHSNEKIAENFDGREIEKDVPCTDEVPRDMWECENFHEAEEVMKARADKRLKVEIFTREGTNKARPWSLQNKSRKIHKTTVARLREILERRRVASQTGE